MSKKDEIIAAFRQHGDPDLRGVMKHVNATGMSGLLSGLVKDGVLKKNGGRGSTWSLLEQGAAGAPPQKRRKGKRRGKKAKARRARSSAPKHEFIAAVDAGTRLICINGAAPLIFAPEQTQKIADVLLQHFEA